MKMRFERPGSLIKRRGASLLLLLLTVMLAACSSDSNEFPEHDNTEEVLAY